MSDRHQPLFQVVIQARPKPTGGYAYLIIRKDNPEWSEGSVETYPTPQQAHDAGRAALKRFLGTPQT
jgi:hypothetical protein